MKKKRICLVGGAGFIGHNIALKLIKNNYEVLIIDSLAVNNYNSIVSNSDNVPNPGLSKFILDDRMSAINNNKINLLIIDARDYHLLSRAITDFNPDILIQLAAVSHANRSNKDPFSTFDHSLRTLENALDATKNKIEHFIYFSSSMVYGEFNEKIVSEETVCNPVGIYGSLKYAGELIVKSYSNVFDTPYTIVRPSALYGERCVSRRVGQIFIENALMGKPLTIKGDANEKLDFTYIEDLVQGIKLVIENKNSRNQVFNLTYGESRSINDMAEIAKEHFNGLKIEYGEKEPFTPSRGTLDISKAKQLLGYDPTNPLEVAYPKYINWYKDLWNKYN
ncbi:NAD(P)-dependent oxidoreductase [Alphaproteobacteria bacterium]|nr:NAD(P)-dependent oxidoreductase [Alphaproteobacteria bacterium]